MRRLVLRAWALVVVGSVAVVLASGAWSWFAGEGSGSSPFSVDVASAEECAPAILSTSASAATLGPDDPATADSTYSGVDCSLAFAFGIPRGHDGTDGADGATGPAGPPGADSTVPGPQGAPGATGPQGAAGADGQSVTITPEPAGANCTHGGAHFSGVGSAYACTGETGAQGPQGVQGQTGATGSQGASGPQGAQGPAGTNGVSGREVVSALSASGSGTGSRSATATCPVGKKVVGGGAVITDDAGTPIQQTLIYASGSYPSGEGAWTAFGAKNGASAVIWRVAAFAICASAL